MRIGNIIAAELDKLRTLPVTILTIFGTILTGILMTAALAATAEDQGLTVTAVDVTLRAVPFVQAGFVLLGILPATQEYVGRQIRTSLTAVPHRGFLAAGKTAAAGSTIALTAIATMAAALATATTTRLLLAVPQPTGDADPWLLIGAAGYLTLIGLLSHAVALIVRHVVPALVSMLSLVLIISPVLAGLTEHARWLPDRAAAQLYEPTDPVLTTGTAALVASAWIVLIGALGIAQFIRRDP